MEIVIGVAGLLLGAALTWIILSNKDSGKRKQEAARFNELEKDHAALQERYQLNMALNEKLEKALSEEQTMHGETRVSLARKEQDLQNLGEKLKNQKTELEEIQKKFTTEFENIANRLLRINSKEFSDLNQKNIGDILNPLKEKIEKFEKKVDETYEKGYKDQTDLRSELKRLYELNSRISEEANNLTRALRSDTKKLGNWGELILDRILEQSGLAKGKEYYSQHSDKNDSGEMIRPDVVVLLPDDKHIIIDSKVSLIAYDQYVNSDDDILRERFLKGHLDSVKDHIKGLAEKAYQTAASLDSPDFVLLFMPIEPAFHLAIQNDPELFYYAWQRKIVIVSPTTLLATLKTVESIWKHEKQTRNAMEIASQGKSMLEKLYGFLEDMEKLGKQIESLQGTYDQAQKRLSTGKGNLVRQAEKLKELGVKTEKSLPEKFTTDEDEEIQL
jgi:DNA recombination protein RmuC